MSETGWGCRRALNRACLNALGLSVLAAQSLVAQGTALRAPPAPGLAAIAGVVDDSLRGGPLVGATVAVMGAPRTALTDPSGLFRLDSIPAGTIRLLVRHPLLDTLLITVSTAPFAVTADRLEEIALATPTLDAVRSNLCPRGGVRAGNGMLAGRVDDADTGAPLSNALVTLVYSEQGVVDANDRVRRARTDADGLYAICGIPETLQGTVQATAGGHATADVPVSTRAKMIETASFLVGSDQRTDSGTVGAAVLAGRITDVAGRPLRDVQVGVEGGAGVAVTAENGTFLLRELPSGTTTASVRKIGYAPATATVHLRKFKPESLTIALSVASQVLAPVTVTAKADQELERLGFNDRLKMGNRSNFLFPEQLEKQQFDRFTDLFRSVPGFAATRAGNYYFLQSSRALSGGTQGCVNVFVDKVRFEQLSPGDLDAAFPVGTIGAIESYPSDASTPSEFRLPGRNCATVVVWTKHRLNRP